MKHRLLLILLASVIGSSLPARAGVLFTFSFSPQPDYQTTSFSFVEPDFLSSAGETVSIQPFTITDGSSTWTFTKAYVSSLCMVFATANGSVGFSGNRAFCSVGDGLFDSGAITTSFSSGGFPTQSSYGSMTGDIEITTFNHQVAEKEYDGAVTLTLSQAPDTPEPASAGLAIFGFAALALSWAMRRMPRACAAWLFTGKRQLS